MTQLVTRREAEPLLGYAANSLKVVMQQQRGLGRWPAPTACRIRDRALLWDLGELLAVGRPEGVRSRRVSGSDPDGLVTCLSCGRRFRSLGPHLARAHQTTAADYRAEHRLPATTTLMADQTRSTLSAARIDLMEHDPEVLDRIRRAALPPAELYRRSKEAIAATANLPSVRANRAAAARRSLMYANAALRTALESKARDAGFGSMTDAIEATKTLPISAAAERIGVGVTTIKRWRARAFLPSSRAAVLEERARSSGFVSMMDAIEATRTMTGRTAAERIGVSVTTVRRWRTKASPPPSPGT
ncbi:MucR family transcriptional regulator [Streptomyces sp. NBC_00073]|uniref:MucR family transcriptional regulator n=1 Tax=Streptomyces sp. NBC_00073 TaxID=2975640 RepID=UPI002F91B60E